MRSRLFRADIMPILLEELVACTPPNLRWILWASKYIDCELCRILRGGKLHDVVIQLRYFYPQDSYFFGSTYDFELPTWKFALGLSRL